jgi:hypothetical protein
MVLTAHYPFLVQLLLVVGVGAAGLVMQHQVVLVVVQVQPIMLDMQVLPAKEIQVVPALQALKIMAGLAAAAAELVKLVFQPLHLAVMPLLVRVETD